MQQAGMMQDNLKSRLPLPSSSWMTAAVAVVALTPWKHLLPATVGVGAVMLGTLGLLGVWQLLIHIVLRRKTDVMVTVEAMKTTNKELKKQYGSINIDKSEYSTILVM